MRVIRARAQALRFDSYHLDGTERQRIPTYQIAISRRLARVSINTAIAVSMSDATLLLGALPGQAAASAESSSRADPYQRSAGTDNARSFNCGNSIHLLGLLVQTGRS